MERRYVLSKVGRGDYLLPSNDAQTVWRITRDEREGWGLWRWRESVGLGDYVDTQDWDRWELCEAALPTRAAAINAAMRAR